MICIWSSWCHCHPIISCFCKIQNGLPFWCRLTQVVLEKRPLNVCVCEEWGHFLCFLNYRVVRRKLLQKIIDFIVLFTGLLKGREVSASTVKWPRWTLVLSVTSGKWLVYVYNAHLHCAETVMVKIACIILRYLWTPFTGNTASSDKKSLGWQQQAARRIVSHPVVIVLCTKLDADCDWQATVVGRLLTTLGDDWRAVTKLFLAQRELHLFLGDIQI